MTASLSLGTHPRTQHNKQVRQTGEAAREQQGERREGQGDQRRAITNHRTAATINADTPTAERQQNQRRRRPDFRRTVRSWSRYNQIAAERIVAHICRRCRCFESVRNMAIACRIKLNRCRRSASSLSEKPPNLLAFPRTQHRQLFNDWNRPTPRMPRSKPPYLGCCYCPSSRSRLQGYRTKRSESLLSSN